MRNRRLLIAVTASIVVMAVAAACSSSPDGPSGGDGGGQTVAAGSVKAGPITGWDDAAYKVDTSSLQCGLTAKDPTRGVTDTSITVGGLAYLTSPTGSTVSGTDVGAKVRFERANAEGGVNGRKINYTGTLDNGDDVSRSISQAKALAQQEKVFAVVPLMTRDSNFLEPLCDDQVPFFGWGTNSGYCKNTIGFGITGCLTPTGIDYTTTAYGLMIQSMLGGDAEGKSTALVGIDNDAAREGLAELAKQVQTVGIRTVYAENPVLPSGVTDATAIVNDIMTSDEGHAPDVVLYVLDFNSVVKLTTAMNAAGFQGKHLNAVGYDPRLAGFKDLDQSYTIVQWTPGVDTTVPAVKQLNDDFQKYAPGTSISLPAEAGYWAADMFLDAVNKAGRDLTVDKLLNLMNNNYTYTVPGTVAETRWPLNHNIGIPCASVVQLNGQKFDITTKLACGSLIRK
ncbi:branched-chain amino acid ABC transporter substrate-binding protein [Frankia sp. R43]|nr:branched-chain amino acid ABC transporter substrate-binding protein [Frankia sp. R43]